MYVRHPPHQHDEVVARATKAAEKKKAKRAHPDSGGGAAQPAAHATDAANKLVIKDKLTEGLCSRLVLSDTDADNLCGEICGPVKD